MSSENSDDSSTDESFSEEQTEFKSRDYQDEILKVCIKRNTIVFLPTGAGKTYIGIMALKHFRKDLEKPMSEGGKRSVYITTTVELAKQQMEQIKKRTPFSVKLFIGETVPLDVNDWDREIFIQAFDENQVFVATNQVILNIINHGYMKLSDFNLFVFDECHNAIKDHPMMELMRKFNEYPESEQPRVIGLTGMLIMGKIKPVNVLNNLREVEGIYRSTIATAKGDAFSNVLLYSTCPDESILEYQENDGNYQKIDERTDSMIKIIGMWNADKNSKYQKICKEPAIQLKNLGLYGGLLSISAAIVEMELKKREAETSSDKLLCRALITSLEEIRHIMKCKIDNYEDKTIAEMEDVSDEQATSVDMEIILKNLSSQVEKLLGCLQKFIQDNPNEPMKGLIFVQRRNDARILCQIIKQYANAFPHLKIKADFMVGYNAFTPDTFEKVCANKNKEVLEHFKCGKINLIIATKVLEEGIDLQECNFVICYATPTTFQEYIQRKGRARMRKSQYVIMTPTTETKKLQVAIATWNQISRMLKEYLTDKAIDRAPPSESEIVEATKQTYNEVYPTVAGASVNFNSAINMLNTYCCNLSSDNVVEWEEVPTIDGQYTVSILLPIMSPIKGKIHGKPMPNSKLAKKSAAFEAVKKLHLAGELTDHLKPVTKKICIDKYKDIYFNTWKQFDADKEKKNEAGTRKNYRMHDIRMPTELTDSIPQINVQLYLYEIVIEPQFQVPENDVDLKAFHRLLRSKHTYGILTAKKLPRMGQLTCYQSFGEITCSVSNEPTLITLDNRQKLFELKRFHCILFRSILDVWKEYFVYDHKDSVIIVPTVNHQIDWNIVKKYQTEGEKRLKMKEKTMDERKNVVYSKEDWQNYVVTKWYRPENTKYIVTQVLEDKTPLSAFPTDDFQNFAEYMTKKYPRVTKVMNNNQFLVGVKPISSHLNFLSPKGENAQEKRLKDEKEFLIPEMCHNFGYPADLWLKAIHLPSILHRMTYTLHAEHIRNTINAYVGISIHNYIPRPLIATQPPSPSKFNVLIEKKEKKEKKLPENGVNVLTPSTSNLNFQDGFDLDRYFDMIYEVDIDFCYYLLNRPSDGFDISQNAILQHQSVPNVPTLPDITKLDEDLWKINMLNTKITTPITRGVEQHDLLAALTTSSSGDIFNMELLEVLGDAFLKFSVSLYLIQRHPEWTEGFLTTIKGQIVGNRNLCYSAIRHNIPGMIKASHFSPKDDWQPPMLIVDRDIQFLMREGNITPDILYKLQLSETEVENGLSDFSFEEFLTLFHNDNNIGGEKSTKQNFLGKQKLSDKTSADCIEAILGACVKSIGIERTFKILQMFEILPRIDGRDISKMLQMKLDSPRIRANISDNDVDYFLTNYKKLEKSIGYRFKDRAYLLQALTHPTFPTNRVTGCYQQLEFLGDAVLDFLITMYIFERCPHMDPGKLTDLRSALVNNITLASLCVRYGMHVHILLQSIVLTESINRFVDFQQKHNYEISEHIELLMDEHETECKIAEYVDVPKALGDVFESIIGAVFLDSGNDLEMTWMFIYRLMEKELHNFIANVPIQTVRQLYEYPNAMPKFSRAEIDTESKNVVVSVSFTCDNKICVKHGISNNKKNAKRAAAELAMKELIQSEMLQNVDT